MVPEGVSEEAEKRLRILEHYTDLGSGYAIALKDLELRGAGSILGGDQSGFVHAVGLDTYTRLLEQTIRGLRDNQSGERHPPTEVNVTGAALIPDLYLADPAQKLSLYRRLSKIETIPEIRALGAEVRDRYGPTPIEVDRLLSAAYFRLLGTQLGVERITLQESAVRVTFRHGVIPKLAALQGVFGKEQVDFEVKRAMPLSFVLRKRGAKALTDILSDALEALLNRQAAAA